ncbi:hypothetical protein Xoosp13_31 [Xanthomonas phage Xoo-sp13]|nr:hypothetical protein Xoosp13_31 [Xanthomonas phage Xoo-sp13]
MSFVILTDLNGTKFRATESQAEAIASLTEARAGGIATVYGYRPTSGYVAGKSPVQDMQVLTRFSTERLYQRKVAALSDIKFSDIREHVEKDPILSKLSEVEAMALFNTRKAEEVASMTKTLTSTDRSDAHRAAHDRCYAKMADGIRVHYVTEKVGEHKEPVLTDGLPTVDSIMVTILELNKTVRVPGEYKVVKSGAPVLMSNCIAKVLNSKSVSLKALSLKEDNFERLIVSRKSYLPEDVAGIPADILNG